MLVISDKFIESEDDWTMITSFYGEVAAVVHICDVFAFLVENAVCPPGNARVVIAICLDVCLDA